MEAKLHAIYEACVTLLTGLAPGAIGAAVGMAWKRGMTWRERFVQLAVGACVSWFIARAIGAIFPGWGDFVVQAIAFTLGMIAFEATPKFITAAADAVATLPARLADRILPAPGTGPDGVAGGIVAAAFAWISARFRKEKSND
jgi:hypothetical protein